MQEGPKLSAFGGQSIPVLGQCEVLVEYGDQSYRLPVVVTDTREKPLCGLDWIRQFQMLSINSVSRAAESAAELLTEFSDVFDS